MLPMQRRGMPAPGGVEYQLMFERSRCRIRLRTCGCWLLLAGLFLSGSTALAQRSRERVQIRNIKFYNRKTPKYQDYSDPRAVSKKEWLQIMAEYESEGGRDGWIDEITLEWHVLVQGTRTFLMHKTITYLDVADGRHHAVVYLRPQFIKRYGRNRRISKNDLQVFLVVRVNGVASDYAFHPDRRPKIKWWELKPPRVRIRDELLSRLDTPFAPLDYDFYEFIRRTSGQ